MLSHQRMSPWRQSAPPKKLTWVEYVAQGAVIKNHDFAQIGFDLSKVLDVSPVAEGAVLPIVSSHKVLALHFQPIDDRIGILLYGGSEDDEVIPLTDLGP
jgi:hypothetical protein